MVVFLESEEGNSLEHRQECSTLAEIETFGNNGHAVAAHKGKVYSKGVIRTHNHISTEVSLVVFLNPCQILSHFELDRESVKKSFRIDDADLFAEVVFEGAFGKGIDPRINADDIA